MVIPLIFCPYLLAEGYISSSAIFWTVSCYDIWNGQGLRPFQYPWWPWLYCIQWAHPQHLAVRPRCYAALPLLQNSVLSLVTAIRHPRKADTDRLSGQASWKCYVTIVPACKTVYKHTVNIWSPKWRCKLINSCQGIVSADKTAIFGCEWAQGGNGTRKTCM